MSLAAVITAIESPQFATFLGLANNSRMFRDVVENIPAARQLLTELKEPANTRKLLARTESLVREQDDVRYRNQRDAAIAIYVWALNETDGSLGRLAASVVLESPRLWWARKTALDILGQGFARPSQQQGVRTVTPDDWNTASIGVSGGSLVVSTPPRELLERERVLNPTNLDVRSEKKTETSATPMVATDYLITTDNPSSTAVKNS